MRLGILRCFEQSSTVHVFPDFDCSEAFEAWRNCQRKDFSLLEFSQATFYQKMNFFPRCPDLAFLAPLRELDPMTELFFLHTYFSHKPE